MRYCIGVDLGGTNIKAGVVDETGRILAEDSRKTKIPRPENEVSADIVETILCALSRAELTLDDIEGVGVGCPGRMDSVQGVVVYSNNLIWREYPLCDVLRESLHRPVYLGNDANVAALGEVWAGSALGASSAVIITLGTGVGAGIVIDSRILTGYNEAASEFGHTVIVYDGAPCTCGRRGCLEAYTSATGLIRMTREAMEQHPESLLWKLTDLAGVDGRIAFIASRKGDQTAAEVINHYIGYLACGLTNVINAIQPEVISLGGGVAKEGDPLLIPLRERVYKEVYSGLGEKYTRIELCTLGYKAGIIGAAMLALSAEDRK
jgi:glucokinase